MNKHGQSMIEYALIAMLVVLGIVIVGPYVLRSIDAHFKLWGYGAADSFSEHVQQAPIVDVPDLPLNCHCPISPGGCGSTQAGSLCGATQREYDYNCNPQGCNGASGNSYCLDDPTCCIALQPLGCGTYPCPATGCPTTTPMPMPTPDNCYFGYELEANICGNANTFTKECVYDAQPSGICPLPLCQGTINTANTAPCPGSPGTPGGAPLSNNAPNIIVASCPNPVGSCEYTCAAGTIFSNGACITSFCEGDDLHSGTTVTSCSQQCGCSVTVQFPSGGGTKVVCGGYVFPSGANDNAICQYFGFIHYVGGEVDSGGVTSNTDCITNPPAGPPITCNDASCGSVIAISQEPAVGCNSQLDGFHSCSSVHYIQAVNCAN